MTFNELITLVANYIQRPDDVNIVQMCGLTSGTASGTVRTAQDIYYKLYNKSFQQVATDSITFIPCSQQAVNTFCYYLVSLDLSQSLIVTKGIDNDYSLPTTPNDSIPIGAFKVVTDASNTFTVGSTAFNATGIATTFYSIDVSVIGSLINQAMRNIERRYNFRCMKVRTSYSLNAGTDTFNNSIPNYKNLISAYATTGNTRYPLTKKDVDFVECAYQPSETGPPTLIAEVSQDETNLTPDVIPNLRFMIRRIPDINYTIVFNAYQYSPYLDGVIYQTNWWTQNAWEILLYSSLVEAEPYLKNDERMATWKAILQEKLSELIKSERTEEYAGSLQYLNQENVY